MPVPTSWSQLSQTAANNSPAGSETVGPLANDYFQAAFSFLRQLYDQGGLPNQALNANSQRITNVANGTALTDAVNLSQLNTTLGAPQGTRVVFQQAATPTGWTLDTSSTFTDCSMRFNNSGTTSGGATGWSAWNFGGQFTSDGHQLSTAEMPSHNHGDAGHGHGYQDNGHNHQLNDGGHSHSYNNPQLPTGGSNCYQNGPQGVTWRVDNIRADNVGGSGSNISINPAGIGITINAGYANIQAAGGNAAHTHTYHTPQVKFADCIVGIKQ